MNEHVISFLEQRKSVPLTMVGAPGPDEGQLETLLKIAARVPDHGRLEPWRFILFRPEHAADIGEGLLKRAEELRGPLSEADQDRERNRINRAPIAVGVVFVPKDNEVGIPEWEQFLSAGAACMNLVTAATAMGFAANWVTGWYSDDADARGLLGLAPHERLAGVVHIGSCEKDVPERPRPDVASLVSDYSGPYKG